MMYVAISKVRIGIYLVALFSNEPFVTARQGRYLVLYGKKLSGMNIFVRDNLKIKFHEVILRN